LVFVLFLAVPLAVAVVISTEGPRRSGLGLGPPKTVFVGASNYWHALTDPLLLRGLEQVGVYFLVVAPVMLGVATAIALLLDRPIWPRLRVLVRTVCFVPYAMPIVIGSILWGFFYQPQLSPFVHMLHAVGVGTLDPLDPRLVFWSITNIITWEWTGYNIIILLTGLQAIPPELYEAARTEGASEWCIARRLKLPLLRPSLIMAALFTLIGVLQMFGEPETLSNLTSSISSHYTPNLYVYTLAFTDNQLPYASAVAVLLAVATGVLSVAALWVTRRFAFQSEGEA
jgi:multiple sugar transport system permease protein